MNCYTRAGLAEEAEPGIFRAAHAKYRCEDMDRDGVDAELVNGPYEQISAIKDPELRAACVRAVNDWARELYEESQGRFIMLLPLPCMTPEEAVGRAAARGRVRPADRGHLRLGVRARAGHAPDVGAGLGRRRRDRNAGQSARLSKRRVATDRGRRRGARTAQPVADAGRQLPDGRDGGADERRRVFRHLRPPQGIRFVLEEAGVGWVPFMFWRFDREYEFGGPESRVFAPDIPLSRMPSEIVKEHVFFTFEVEEEGGFRRVPEVGYGNFLWASDFPGSTARGRIRGRWARPGRSGAGQGGAAANWCSTTR